MSTDAPLAYPCLEIGLDSSRYLMADRAVVKRTCDGIRHGNGGRGRQGRVWARRIRTCWQFATTRGDLPRQSRSAQLAKPGWRIKPETWQPQRCQLRRQALMGDREVAGSDIGFNEARGVEPWPRWPHGLRT